MNDDWSFYVNIILESFLLVVREVAIRDWIINVLAAVGLVWIILKVYKFILFGGVTFVAIRLALAS